MSLRKIPEATEIHPLTNNVDSETAMWCMVLVHTEFEFRNASPCDNTFVSHELMRGWQELGCNFGEAFYDADINQSFEATFSL